MPNAPRSVEDYLAQLPPERREALGAVREVLLANLDPRIEETLQDGMIGYVVPHSVYPQGYHCDPDRPLPFASLASQKRHLAAYLFCLYTDDEQVARFAADWKSTGKRLDMGKACVRFRSLEDVPLEVFGRAVAAMTLERFLEGYEAQLAAGPRRRAAASASGKAAKRATRRTAAEQATEKGMQKAAKESARKSAKKATKKAAKNGTKRATPARKASDRSRRAAR